MIKFKCANCGHRIGVPNKYASKKVRCPNCKTPLRVPEPARHPKTQPGNIIKFRCPNCNQKIGVTADHAGKKVRCAKCKDPLRVPDAPARPPTTDETAVLKAGREQHPEPQSAQPELQGMDELLAAEADQPSLELLPPIELEPAPLEDEHPVGNDEFAEFSSSGALLSAGRSPIPPRQAAKKTSPIIIGAVCAAAGLLVAIAAWHFITAPGKTTTTGPPFAHREAQNLVVRYISLLQAGDFDEAANLLTPDLGDQAGKTRMQQIADQIDLSAVYRFTCTKIHVEDRPDGPQCILLYSLDHRDGRRPLVASVLETDRGMEISGIAVQDAAAGTLSIGPRGFNELSAAVASSVIPNRASVLTKYFCGFAVVWLVFILVYIVSLWIVFDRAGQPGWAAIIPYYNMWVLAEVGGKPGWWGLAACFIGMVPIVGWIISIVLIIMISIGVAETFGRGTAFGLGLCFLPFIFYPILAFSSN